MKRAFVPALIALGLIAVGSARAADIGKSEEGFGAINAVSDDQLAAERAKGGDPAISCIACRAEGTSAIAGNAFQNAAGVLTVIQNTGNQVFMDALTIVNVSIGK